VIVPTPVANPGPRFTTRTPRLGPLVSIGVALCACLIAGGLFASTAWATRPGAASLGPRTWPSDSQLQRADGSHTLVVFAHPHCPCTAASLRELALIVAKCGDRLEARVVFSAPPGAPEAWETSDLWQHAAAMPGVSVVSDREGREARRFGAQTSGAVYLYDTRGALRFAGGITGSRGHEGDNTGRSSVIGLVLEGASGAAATPVFGCALFGTEPPPQDREPEDRPQ